MVKSGAIVKREGSRFESCPIQSVAVEGSTVRPAWVVTRGTGNSAVG